MSRFFIYFLLINFYSLGQVTLVGDYRSCDILRSVDRNITYKFRVRISMKNQGSHSDWKTWKNGKAFSSQGKVREF